MKEIQVWESLVNTDMEGRGPKRHVGYFFNQDDAVKSVKNHVMGADEVHQKTITIFDSYEEFSKEATLALRRSALARLSPEERRALGIENL